MRESERIGWPALSARVEDELQRQYEMWGEQEHRPNVWYLIVAEEVGEVAKALLERDPLAARAEITQAIACLAHLHAARWPDEGDEGGEDGPCSPGTGGPA